LIAEVIGIGTRLNDIIPPACNRSSEVRELLFLTPGREVYASIALGYPKYKFKQNPPRQLVDTCYLD